MELRKYQREAIDALYSYWDANTGNPLIVLPTGTGKSLVIAKFIEGATRAWPETRILICTHVKELVGQNYNEFMLLMPFSDTGIYSAGLGRKDKQNQILFCGIQSVYKKAYELQRCDILFIDESHTIPPEGEGMWLSFIADLKTINPSMKVIGLTATDYRLDSGNLTGNGIFHDVCYRYDVLRALEEGYLCPVIPKNMVTQYDVSQVGKRGGEYIAGELERAVNIDALTISAINEIEVYGAERKSWLIFASGNKHAAAIHAELQLRGYSGACVTQDTERAVRDRAVIDIKSGAIRYIVNNKIFTTGFNAPNIDLIADLGPTQSAGLHVQKVGRGMRNWPGKVNCLLLDFARNVFRHGPIDRIKGRDKRGGGDGDAPVKVCEECHCVCFAGCRVCPDCGAEFPESELKIDAVSVSAPIVSTQIEPEWHDVLVTSYGFHQKAGGKPVMRVTHSTMNGKFMEWICFEHTGFAREKACAWHKLRSMEPVPNNVMDALGLKYKETKRVCVRPQKDNPKYFEVMAAEIGGEEVIEVPIAVENIEDWEIRL